MVGKKLVLPIVHREIPLIADDYVDMEFANIGSGKDYANPTDPIK